ncbi:MAG: hypothetical protein WCD28_14060 [Nitrososphaeraceae archaeon]
MQQQQQQRTRSDKNNNSKAMALALEAQLVQTVEEALKVIEKYHRINNS